ncbi:anaphase-promoting complex subunit 4-like [Sinocyclocheilus rhinocerous]|uniref:anaphase-promoting complex subunit 4-like n=1 Tax=Sinocyclocheilus rhinocerous TaxID=307959 RepID=UPI0007BA2A44|nr:PREDICTED: anaphase-promoting complex subunit 4-like [Sinocyclocheilus rhinocerous]
MPVFRQVGEKQLPNPILYMAWSPNRDLIALANTAGELLLHRLANFQRVWSLLPNENTGKEITSLAWRPDGKVLAFSVGDTKQVVLCDAEKAEILHLFPVEYPASCMHWTEVHGDSSTLSSFSESEDESSRFLPKLPTLPKSYSTTSKIFSEEKSDEVTNLLGEVRLNILVVGGPSGFVELYAYGLYKIATLSGISGTCRSLGLSSDLKSLSVITEIRSAEDNPEIHYIQLDTGLLSSCLPELTKMARKFTHISTLLQYLRLSLTCMCEAWEEILMQMDLRLTKFVQEKNTSTQVQDEFLELLLWGHFLLFTAMLRMSEDHVPPELNKMTQKDLAFVADFLSEHFSANEELFDRKGKYFNVERVGQYLKDEDEDLISPPNMEGNQWVTFVKQSTHLKDSPLLFPTYPQKSLHFVKRMMEGSIDLCLQKPAEVIGHSVTQAVCLRLYTVPESSENTPRLFELPSLWNDKKAGMHHVVFCMPEISPSKIYILRRATDPSRSVPNGLVALNFNTPLNSSIDDETPAPTSADSCYSCLDARFYDDETLTVVLRSREDDENKMRVLAQLHLNSVLSWNEEFTWDLTLRLEQQTEGIPVQCLAWGNQSREMDNLKAQFVAVNGIRKVACVLSANLRHVRVFEMDAEEEEEEEERADESQEMSSDQDRFEDTMTNQSDAGEGGDGAGGAEDAQVAGQGSGDILDETAGSDTL